MGAVWQDTAVPVSRPRSTLARGFAVPLHASPRGFVLCSRGCSQCGISRGGEAEEPPNPRSCKQILSPGVAGGAPGVGPGRGAWATGTRTRVTREAKGPSTLTPGQDFGRGGMRRAGCSLWNKKMPENGRCMEIDQAQRLRTSSSTVRGRTPPGAERRGHDPSPPRELLLVWHFLNFSPYDHNMGAINTPNPTNSRRGPAPGRLPFIKPCRAPKLN